jgi:hypothetical protein
MLSRLSSFSGPLSSTFRRQQNSSNLILDLQSTIGLSGVTWNDQSAYNNDATLYGTIATASIESGAVVLSLDGVNDYILPTGGFGNLLDSGLTYEVWVSPGTSSNGTLLSEWSGLPPTGWNDSQMGFFSNKINVGVYSDVLSSYITGPTFSVNNWYNIVMTYDHLTNIVSLYINGFLFTTTSTIKENPSSTYLSLGRPDTANTYLGGLSGYFKGYIGSWRIWNGPLTSTQILSNYNDSKSTYEPFAPTQLLLNSSFDNGATNWTATGGFGAYSYTSSNRVAVLNGVLYFTYVSRTVSQSVTVSDIIPDVNTFTGVLNIKRIENTINVNDTYSFVLLFKNSSGTTIVTKTTGTVIAPQNFTDITLTLNRSEIPLTFNNITSVQVNITGIDAGFWNGNHGPMVDYVTLTAS